MGSLIAMFGAGGMLLVAFFCGRAIAAYAFGVRGRRAWTFFPSWLEGASPMAAVVTACAGAAGCYAALAIGFSTARLMNGDVSIDSDSMKVTVAPGGPASAAGARDGDRVLAVNGQPVRDWSDLKTLVGAHPAEAIDLDIDRSGTRMTLHPIPSGRPAKILVGPMFTTRPVGFGEAIGFGIVTPPRIQVMWVRGMIGVLRGGYWAVDPKGRASAQDQMLIGPVGMVREGAKGNASQAASVLLAVASSYLWAIVLLSAATSLASHRRKTTSAA